MDNSFKIPEKTVWVALDSEGFVRVDTIRHQKIKPTNEIIPLNWKWVSVAALKLQDIFA